MWGLGHRFFSVFAVPSAFNDIFTYHFNPCFFQYSKLNFAILFLWERLLRWQWHTKILVFLLFQDKLLWCYLIHYQFCPGRLWAAGFRNWSSALLLFQCLRRDSNTWNSSSRNKWKFLTYFDMFLIRWWFDRLSMLSVTSTK